VKDSRSWTILALLLAAWTTALPGQDQGNGALGESPPLKPEEAERLFLKFIYDKSSLVRSCMFLGGVKIGEVTYKENLATAQVRYRIQCQQEEIDAPPLDRTLKEDFLYRYLKDHWELVGRATELPPAAKEPPPDSQAPPPDPTSSDRKKIAEQILAWAVLGKRPPGVDSRFPGGSFFKATGKVLVSNENLAGAETLSLPGREVTVLSPEALIQRTVLLGGGVWLRFETLEVSKQEAHAVVGVMAPVLPGPAPGNPPTKTLARVSADFLQHQSGWIMTRYKHL